MKKAIIVSVIMMLTSAKIAAGYTPSAAISYSNQSNITIDGKSFTTGTSGASIYLTNCTNVKITNCQFLLNKDIIGIQLNTCSNVEISGNYFESFRSGVYAVKCTGGINIYCNSFKNIAGIVPRGQMVQFNTCSGTGNRVNYNILDHTFGTGDPEDLINMYASYGTTADPIQIIGNKLRGGGPSKSGGGIMIGDNGGHDLRVEDNILVNVGQYGIGCPAGYNMTIKNNKIYGQSFTWTNVGIYVGLPGEIAAGFPCNGPTIRVEGNQVKFYNKAGTLNSWWGCSCCSGYILSGNNFNAPIDASILPATLILDGTACGSQPVPTKTKTPAPTKTRTPAATYTRTRTATPVNTKTFTPTATRTRTATPANTMTHTPANTKTRTPALTYTRTVTPSMTPTFTKTSSFTSTSTPVSTYTRTSTPSRTATMTFTATSSRTATGTLTFTVTSSPTATGTLTFTATSSPTATGTFTFTATSSLTATGTGTFTATSSPTSTASPTGTYTKTPTPTFSCTFTPSATPSMTPENTASFTATATATMTAIPDSEMKILEVLPFPNPATAGSGITFRLNIRGNNAGMRIRIYTVAGRLVRQFERNGLNNGENDFKVDRRLISDLSAGTYYYEAALIKEGIKESKKGVLIILK